MVTEKQVRTHRVKLVIRPVLGNCLDRKQSQKEIFSFTLAQHVTGLPSNLNSLDERYNYLDNKQKSDRKVVLFVLQFSSWLFDKMV